MYVTWLGLQLHSQCFLPQPLPLFRPLQRAESQGVSTDRVSATATGTSANRAQLQQGRQWWKRIVVPNVSAPDTLVFGSTLSFISLRIIDDVGIMKSNSIETEMQTLCDNITYMIYICFHIWLTYVSHMMQICFTYVTHMSSTYVYAYVWSECGGGGLYRA